MPLSLLLVLPLLAVLILPVMAWPAMQSWRQALLDNQAAQLQIAADSIAGLLAEDKRFLIAVDKSNVGSRFTSVSIDTPIVLDGRLNDWPQMDPVRLGIDHLLEIHAPFSADSLSWDLRIGSDRESLYLHYTVRDDIVVYREVGQLSVHRNDHIRISLLDAGDNFRQYTIATLQPSEIVAMEIGGNGRALRPEPDISGRWRATEEGYQVEIAIPLALVKDRISTLVADVDSETSRSIRFLMGAGHTRDRESLGQLIYSPTRLEQLIAGLPYGVRIVGVDGETLASSRFEIDGIAAEAAITTGDRKLGMVLLRQPDSAVNRLFDSAWVMMLVLFAAVLSFVVLATLISRYLIQQRLKEVQHSVDKLIDNRGRVVMNGNRESGGDDISQLADGLAGAVERIGHYNDYLERMAGRLNHELKTPVSIVKSSIENLQETALSDQQAVYAERAAEGVQRLNNILGKMSEARRLEESLDEDEIVRFDLVEVVKGCVAGYQTAFGDQKFELSVETDQIPVTGIPELIAQLLDKLVDNAVEFSRDGVVRVRLNVEDEFALLRVMNDGACLPEGMNDALFESMVTVRDDSSRSHLGLGLYVASIIADFHGADLKIANREDAPGVIVTLKVPLLRITSRLR